MIRLENKNGLVAEFSPIGASLQRFLVPDSDGHTNIIMSPADPMAPRSTSAYAGAILGPIAGRVRNGRIAANGVTSSLDQNDGQNHLHGGTHGLSDVEWQYEQHNQQCISFFTSLPDGLDGYPGNRVFEVKYILSNDNVLSLSFHASSDVATWFNLSTHIYWNLSGNLAGPILDHLLQIPSSKVVFNRSDHTTNELVSVSETVFDFRITKPLSQLVQNTIHDQIRIAKGLNHLFLLEHTNGKPNYDSCLTVFHPQSRRQLLISTSLPCQWVYTGGYLNTDHHLLNDRGGEPYLAVAFEPQLRNWDTASEVMSDQITPQTNYNAWIKFCFSQPGLDRLN